MKMLRNNHSPESDQFHFYSLLLFCFCLPLWSQGAVLAIIALLANVLYKGYLWQNYRQLFKTLPLTSFALYGIYLLGLVYTNDMNEGLSDVETKLSLLVLPVVFFVSPKMDQRQTNQILLGFSVACLLAIIRGSILYYYYGQPTDGTFLYFTNHLPVHSSYFCLYLGMCIFFLADQISKIDERSEVKSIHKRAYQILLLCLIAAVYYLYARMGFLILTFLLSVFYLRFKISKGAVKEGIVRLILGLAVVVFFAKIIPQTNYLLLRKIHISQSSVEKKQALNPRISIWSAAVELIQEAPMLGYGTGDVQVEMLKAYEQRKFRLGIEKNFNPHSQYLHSTVALGAIGLLLLLINFIAGMMIAFRKKHYFFLFFLLLFAMGCLTESMLETESGVLFYTFFYGLFGSKV